jgi:hypothetical protein
MLPIHPVRSTSNERGATIIVVALSMLALLSMMALAVDVGMLLTARAEAQRAADSAALAGAGALIFEPDDDDFENGVVGSEALIADDPIGNEVVGSAWDSWAGSPRVGIVPTFDPARFFRPGRKDIVFTNFIAVFFESVSGKGNKQQVNGRILYATGIGGGSETAPGAKFVQLIE